MKRIYIVTAILLLLLVTSCQPTPAPTPTPLPSPKPTPSPAPTPAPEPTPAPKEIAKMGEEASNGQAAVTVHSVKFYDQITGGLGSTNKPRKEGCVFAIVDLTIKNVSDFALEAGAQHVRLLDNQNKGCSRTMLIIAGWPHDLRKLATKKDLQPGEQTRGMVVFTAKEGTILDKVSYIVATPPIEFGLGELEKEASNGQAAVTVHSVNFCDQITDGEGNIHKPLREGNVFAVVDLSIRNISGSTLKVGPPYVLLLDKEDRPCSRSMLRIRGWPYEVQELDKEELAPTEETRGIVIFDTKGEAFVSKVSYSTPESTIKVSLEGLEVSVPPYRMPGLGGTARGGGIAMKVNNVMAIEELKTEYGEEKVKLILTQTAKEGYQLVVIDLAIKNVSIEPDIKINPLNVLLIDTKSKAYGKVMLTVALGDELSVAELSPGDEVWGKLLFNVPKGVELDRVMYKIGALGPPVQVSIR